MRHVRAALAIAFIGLILPGCETIGHGLVSDTPDRDTARVKLGSEDGLVVGQRVSFVRQDCDFHPAGDENICRNDLIGGGTVTRVLGEHEAVVRPDENVTVQAGMAVEEQELAH